MGWSSPHPRMNKAVFCQSARPFPYTIGEISKGKGSKKVIYIKESKYPGTLAERPFYQSKMSARPPKMGLATLAVFWSRLEIKCRITE